MFVVLIGVAQIAFLVLSNTLAEGFLASLDLPPGTTETAASVPLSPPVSATMAGVLSIIVLLALQVITVVRFHGLSESRIHFDPAAGGRYHTLHALDDRGDALSEPDAHRRERVLLSRAL